METWLLQVFLLFLRPEFALSGICDACPNGWVKYEESCYMFVDEQQFDWTEATHHCVTHEGAHLVVIDSAGEELTLRDFARRLYKAHSSSATSFWIGATDDVTEGLWVWYTNRKLVSSGYNNWAPGQPQNFASYDQDCACLYGPSGFLWEDCGCSNQLHAICEKNFTAGDVEQIIG